AAEALRQKITSEMRNGKLILITSHVLSELDDLITEVFYMHEGSLVFHKKLSVLQEETGEQKLSRAVAKILSEKVA
ncbi:MAG: ABC transporter ATP-binding protein, partial [Flavitalea sp.]